jgi:hypothetical protein
LDASFFVFFFLLGVLSNAFGLQSNWDAFFSAGNKGSRYQHLSKSISPQRQIAD